jgi:hypothetical protein
MAEGQVLQDAIGIGRVHDFGGAEVASAFRAFRGQQVAFASTGTHHFAGSGYFKAFGHRFSRFYSFRSSHKFKFQLKSAQYRLLTRWNQAGFFIRNGIPAHKT